MSKRPSVDRAMFDIMILPCVLMILAVALAGYDPPFVVMQIYTIAAAWYWLWRFSKYNLGET